MDQAPCTAGVRGRSGWDAMTSSQEPDGRAFARLLRQLRVDAGLTQEELAFAARVGSRSVSDLERGVSRSPRPQTARLLATALGLSGPQREEFLATARGRILVPEPG